MEYDKLIRNSVILERTVNEKLSKKLSWALFVVGVCIVPYLVRLGFYFFWKEDLEDFYMSELDLFSFCIAVLVALFIEINKLKKIPLDLEIDLFKGMLAVCVVFIFIFIYFSLDCEHQTIILKHKYEESLKNNGKSEEIINSISRIESKKIKLFIGSIIMSIGTIFISYKTLFHKENV